MPGSLQDKFRALVKMLPEYQQEALQKALNDVGEEQQKQQPEEQEKQEELSPSAELSPFAANATTVATTTPAAAPPSRTNFFLRSLQIFLLLGVASVCYSGVTAVVGTFCRTC